MLTRRGECNACGHCCRYIGASQTVVENAHGLSDVAFYRTRGFTLHHANGVAVKATAQVWHEKVCPEHRGDTCHSYETRPQTCRDFPSTPEQVIGTPCSYWFEDGHGTKVGGLGSPYPYLLEAER